MPERRKFEYDTPYYHKSIGAYVMVPEPKDECIPSKKMIDNAREQAASLVDKEVKGVEVYVAEVMSLSQYLPVLQESMNRGASVKSKDSFNQMLPHLDGEFYSFASENVCLLDSHFDLGPLPHRSLWKKFQDWRNPPKHPPKMLANLYEHGILELENKFLPGPHNTKVWGNWEKYYATVIQHMISDNTLLTIDDPKDFDTDYQRAIFASCTDACTYPKYIYLNAMGSIHRSPPQAYNNTSSTYAIEFSTPLILYPKDGPPCDFKSEETDSETVCERLDGALKSVFKEAFDFLDQLGEQSKKKVRKPKRFE